MTYAGLRINDLEVRVAAASVQFTNRRLATPLVLSSGAIEEITEAEAEVVVETRSGLVGAGRGAIYLSDLWAWPDPALSHDQRDAALRTLCETVAAELPAIGGGEYMHPLEWGLRLHDWVCHRVDAPENPTSLACAMCGSPFDAALHDATGVAVERSAFTFYDEKVALPTADRHFHAGDAAGAIRRLIQPPRRTLPAWYVVGKNDDLAGAVEPALRNHGYRCLKLKITGSDVESDVDRTSEVFQRARSVLKNEPTLTVDSNEANRDASSVLEYLERLEAVDFEAYSALAYLEQPTARDIRAFAYDWREATARRPVLLDEGLTDLEILPEAAAQGWSGLALKTCKGHSFLLTAAAWASEHGLSLALQDLTNPGIALIHAAAVGAHLPTINGAELNSPQFTPEANRDFLPRLSDLFMPRDGVHRLPERWPPGIGSQL